MSELPTALDALVRWNGHGGKYRGTFVLDHDNEQNMPEFVAGCREAISRQFPKAVR